MKTKNRKKARPVYVKYTPENLARHERDMRVGGFMQARNAITKKANDAMEFNRRLSHDPDTPAEFRHHFHERARLLVTLLKLIQETGYEE